MELIHLRDEEVKSQSKTGCCQSDCAWKNSVVIATCSLILYIVGFSTPRWAAFSNKEHDSELDNPAFIHMESVKVDRNIGLWMKCSTHKVGGGPGPEDDFLYKVCEDMDNHEQWKPATKILCCLGLCLCVVGYFVTLATFWKKNRPLLSVSGSLFIMGSVMGAIGGLTFVGMSDDNDHRFNPHYSAIFFLISCFLLMVSGCLQLLSNKMAGYYPMA